MAEHVWGNTSTNLLSEYMGGLKTVLVFVGGDPIFETPWSLQFSSLPNRLLPLGPKTLLPFLEAMGPPKTLLKI